MTEKPETSMRDHLNESLSALMDNEAEELELRRVLRELKLQDEAQNENGHVSGNDEALLSTWSRYHLVRDILKQQEPRQASPAILAGVRAALAVETTPQLVEAKAGKGVKGVWSAITQGAIAASVALVVLFTAHSLQQQPEDSGDLTASNASSQYVEGEFNRVVSYQGEGAELDSQTRDRLRQAVYREIEQAPRVQYSIPVNFPEVPQQQ